MEDYKKIKQATRMDEEQQGVLSDNMPRYGDGYYLSRYNYGNNPYLFYDTPIFLGKIVDPGFPKWQTDALSRVWNDFNLEAQKDAKTMHYHCICACKALLRCQSQMDEEVIQDTIERIHKILQVYEQGGRRRSRRGVE